MATSGRPYQFAATALDAALGDPAMSAQTLLDEGSDMDVGDEDYVSDLDRSDVDGDGEADRHKPLKDSRRSSHVASETLAFHIQPILPPAAASRPSGLTSALNKHVPHLVSTSTRYPETRSGSRPESPSSPVDQQAVAGPSNPFASLYTTVAAPSGVPSQRIELYFPHSDDPASPLVVTVRNDATVEEVTGHGLYRFWEEGREPGVGREGPNDVSQTTIGWGLRIVEDDGEVDEDFPRMSGSPATSLWLLCIRQMGYSRDASCETNDR